MLERPFIDSVQVAAAVRSVLAHLDLVDGDVTVAVFVSWQGSATFQRLDALCRGLIAGLASMLERGHPLVLVGDGDVGGLLGIHCREELRVVNAIVSIDGLELKEFDYIDIGAILENSGAVPSSDKITDIPALSGVRRQRHGSFAASCCFRRTGEHGNNGKYRAMTGATTHSVTNLARVGIVAALIAVFAVMADQSTAQDYPTHPIRLVVALAPGGADRFRRTADRQ